jgi:hypothetical protein
MVDNTKNISAIIQIFRLFTVAKADEEKLSQKK